MPSRLIIITVFLLAISGCRVRNEPNRSIGPNKVIEIKYPQNKQLIQKVPLQKSTTESLHAIRVKDREKPHYHDNHSLRVVVTAGCGYIHFRNKKFRIKPGDQILIPPKTLHWAQSLCNKPLEVIAAFSPPFDGKDIRAAQESGGQ